MDHVSQHDLLKSNDDGGIFSASIDAVLELGAYESLWSKQSASFKWLAETFAGSPQSRPSDLVPEAEARAAGQRVLKKLRARTKASFDICVYGDALYPSDLRDATYPVELLYYQGCLDLLHTRSVAVVGTRKPSSEGVHRTNQLVRQLLKDRFTIASGLAEGIDTAAHKAAIHFKGKTFAVIGTPLGHVYPKQNVELQERLARDYLVVSQVPVERYESQDYRFNRVFFPERNKTMSALTEATIIVEASETSGTLVQAREALRQKRKLFILNSCFERGDLQWPFKFEEQGAIRVRSYDDIRRELVPETTDDH